MVAEVIATADKRLAELIVRYDLRTTRGEDVTPEEICKDTPALLPKFRAYLSRHSRPASDSKCTIKPPRHALAGFSRLRHLGQGGMGDVYAAVEDALGRTVAIKFPRTDSPQARRRFLMEARLHARLRHANTVTLHALAAADGEPYLVMEYVPGGNLAEGIGTPWDAGDAVALVLGIAHGVSHAHRHGVIHRDLKPSNIFLDTDGTVKIGDFGIATLVGNPVPATVEVSDTPLPGLTRTGAQIGTPGYAAPELLKPNGTASAASDVYSIGVILRELLTGDRVADPLRDRIVPLGLQEIIDRCTEVLPRYRYGSAEELIADLERWQARRALTDRVLRVARVVGTLLLIAAAAG